VGKITVLARQHIGIGTPIAERPSHTTGHTDHVSGDSAGQTDTDKTMGLLGLGERNATSVFPLAAGLHNTSKNTLFDSHDHLPKPFGWGLFGPSPG